MSNPSRSPRKSVEPCLAGSPMNTVLLGTVLLVVAAIPGCDSRTQPEPKFICLTHIGDDGLTNRMTEALETRIRDERQWTLGGCSIDDSLFASMRAPEWSTVDSRVEVRPTLTLRNGRLAESVMIDTRCWDDELDHCVDAMIDKMMSVAATWD